MRAPFILRPSLGSSAARAAAPRAGGGLRAPVALGHGDGAVGHRAPRPALRLVRLRLGLLPRLFGRSLGRLVGLFLALLVRKDDQIRATLAYRVLELISDDLNVSFGTLRFMFDLSLI